MSKVKETTYSNSLNQLGTEVGKMIHKKVQAKEFGKYILEQELGRGGMGVVYRAYDTELKRRVALKITQTQGDEKKSLRFLREASAMAKLEHPNILKIYEIGKDPQNHYTMELVKGLSLKELIEKSKINLQQLAEIIYKVCEALVEVHNANLIHRDIKPANIMITDSGEPKLMDFGLVKVSQKEMKLSKTGEILGTPAYMAPEQLENKPCKSSDIYAIGATLYEGITKRSPFIGDSSYNLMLKVFEEKPIPPSVLNKDVPEELEAICLKCLEKDPSKRYLNAQQLAVELNNYLEHRPIIAKSYGISEHMNKFSQRNEGMLKIVLLVSSLWLLLFLVQWYLWYGWYQQELKEKFVLRKKLHDSLDQLDKEQKHNAELEKEVKAAVLNALKEGLNKNK